MLAEALQTNRSVEAFRVGIVRRLMTLPNTTPHCSIISEDKAKSLRARLMAMIRRSGARCWPTFESAAAPMACAPNVGQHRASAPALPPIATGC